MPELHVENALLSRRGALKIGVCASALLATAGLSASLSGCSASSAARGFAILRSSDLAFLRALIPVMLLSSVATTSIPDAANATLHKLDDNLNHLSPALLALTQQLFDVLAMPVTRGPLTGVWGRWENASTEQVQHFLQRWQNSSLNLLRMGHSSLVQLVMMSWYERPEAWAACGYPGRQKSEAPESRASPLPHPFEYFLCPYLIRFAKAWPEAGKSTMARNSTAI